MLNQVQHDEAEGAPSPSPSRLREGSETWANALVAAGRASHPVTAITALCSDFGVILEPAAAGCGVWGALGTDDGT